MFDLQHIPNIDDSKRLIGGFSIGRGVAIALPIGVHRKLGSQRYPDVFNARTLLAREIVNLRSNTDIPIEVLQKIIDLNKNRYPDSFKKMI